MSPLPIRVGIIGLGGFAGIHHERIRQLEADGHARLVCTCDPQAAQFLDLQAQWEFPRRGVDVLPDYRLMIAKHREHLDMLVIPTPIPLHAEMHRAGVEAGLAVYLEKPPTLDHAELESMIACDRTARKATLVGFNFIVEEPRLALKSRVLSGEFGRPLEARLIACWARPASYFKRNTWAGRLLAPDGRVVLDSCLGNAMAHYVHNLLFWAGQDTLHSWGHLRTVQAELYRAHDIEGPDTVFAETVTTGGTVLRIGLTHSCHALSTQQETIVCEKATLYYLVNSRTEIHWHDGRVETTPLSEFDAVSANHLDYYRYLRGETARPATTLADSRPFVHLNNLAYISSNEITSLPEDAIRHITTPDGLDHHLAVHKLTLALRQFTKTGLWPGRCKGWRASPSALVTPEELPRFHEVVKRLAALNTRSTGTTATSIIA